MTDAIGLIVAMDEHRLIGREGQLPWRLPDDLRHFRRLTLGKTVLMGRKTFASLGKPLDGRNNRVLSRDAAFQPPGCRVFKDLKAALSEQDEGELMVIGGADLYRQTLPLARRLYLTRVHASVEGDTWFPPFDEAEFRELERVEHAADDRHCHAFSFVTLERR